MLKDKVEQTLKEKMMRNIKVLILALGLVANSYAMKPKSGAPNAADQKKSQERISRFQANQEIIEDVEWHGEHMYNCAFPGGNFDSRDPLLTEKDKLQILYITAANSHRAAKPIIKVQQNIHADLLKLFEGLRQDLQKGMDNLGNRIGNIEQLMTTLEQKITDKQKEKS
jgi:hypothetical protein